MLAPHGLRKPGVGGVDTWPAPRVAIEGACRTAVLPGAGQAGSRLPHPPRGARLSQDGPFLGAGREGTWRWVGVTGLWRRGRPWTLPVTSPLPRPGGREGQAVAPSSPPPRRLVLSTQKAEGILAQGRVWPSPAASGLSWLFLPQPKLLAKAHDSSREGRGWPVTPLRERDGLRWLHVGLN